MTKTKQLIFQAIGAIGAVICLVLYFRTPSFPTPDKLIIFLIFVFLILKDAIQMIIRLGPFVLLILVYESFRSVANQLNHHVHYGLAPHFDRWLFGRLPTVALQQRLWKGHVSWYDVVLYIPYLLFFIVPLALAILVWKTRDKDYWRVVATYLVVFFAAFLTFLAYPAAPPWLASQNHFIEPITRVSSSVWSSLGLHNFPSFYNRLAPNPVAAVPSLHAACGLLFSLFIFKLYGRRWGLISLIYPMTLIFGIVYEGEHYVFDVLCGLAYALAGFWVTPKLMAWAKPRFKPPKRYRRLIKRGLSA
jgi:membrane-associated phospholipid phosphatase